MGLRLQVIYGTALAVELALRQQNAEHDVDLAHGLRGGVCDPIAAEAEHLQDIVKRLEG